MRKILFSLLAGVMALSAAPIGSILKANAGEKQSVFMEEQFGKDALDQDKWTANGDSVSLYADKESGYLYSSNNIEGHKAGIKDAIVNLDYIQFDWKPNTKWHAFYFSKEEETGFGDYTPEIFINCGNTTRFTPGQGEVGFTNQMHGMSVGEWYTIRFKRVDSLKAEIYICPQGEDIANAPKVTDMNVNPDIASWTLDSFYFAFGNEGGGEYWLDNLIIKSDTVDFEERFYEETINEQIKSYGVPFDVIRPDSSLTFTAAKAGDSVIYNAPVSKETSIIEDLDVAKAKFNVAVANAGDAIAYVFGMGEDKNYANDSYACVMESNGFTLVQYANGAQTELLAKVPVNLTGGAAVQLVLNKIGTVSVYVEDTLMGSCEVEEKDFYAGSFGFVAMKDNGGAVSIDNVRLVTKLYKVPVTKSVSHNFSNDFFGNEGYEDFVYNVDAGKIFVEDGKLVLDGISDNSYFGSAHEYDNFIVDYKLCSIKVGPDATTPNHWLGLDIGRKMSGALNYGSHFMLLYQITPTETSVGLGSYTSPESDQDMAVIDRNIIQHKRIPSEYFEAIQYDGAEKTEEEVLARDALCVRYIAENGTVRMYLKRNFEPEYTLYATVQNVETTGYVSINCTGFTTLKLDDFSVSNISSVYVNADSYAPETIIKDNIITIYDNNNAEDYLAFEEVKANSSSGCGSSIVSSWYVVPMALAGVAMLKKRKDNEDK